MKKTIAHTDNFKVILCGGKYQGTYTRKEILEKFNPKNFTEDGEQEREERKRLGFPLISREELDCQPILEEFGYIGPMWDGGKLRYETQEVYDSLSM